MLNITVNDFKTLFDGRWVDWDGADGNQCFDLAQFWNKVLGGQPFTGATADLIYNQPQNIYTQVANTPDNFPVLGDIIVWNWPHVGIVLSADANNVTVLEQNDPTNGSCQVKTYNYSGVIGWLHPSQLPQDQQQVIDDLRKARDDNWNLYQGEVQQVTQLKDQLTQEQAKSSQLQQEVNDLTQKNDDNQKTIIGLKQDTTNLGAVIARISSEDKQYAQEALDAGHQRDTIKIRFNNVLFQLDLEATASDDEIRQRIQELKAPQTEALKHYQTLYDLVFTDFVYKRVPRAKSFFAKLFHLQ